MSQREDYIVCQGREIPSSDTNNSSSLAHKCIVHYLAYFRPLHIVSNTQHSEDELTRHIRYMTLQLSR